MKLAFSTLGCPGWSWNEIYATAKDLGLNGIEVRGIENEMNATRVRQFLPEHLQETLNSLTRAHLDIPMLTSAAALYDKEGAEAALTEGKAYIDLAHRMGVPFVRVLGDKGPCPEFVVDVAFVKSQYETLCTYAKGKGVHVLIETNGVFADTRMLSAFMEGMDPAVSGVLWDIHHPWRCGGELPAETAGNIGKYVKYVHIKDSVNQNGKTVYRMLGYGDVPVLDALHELHNLGYDGYVSLEWVKRWNPDLQEPGVVFSHFQSYMAYLIRQL